MFSRRASLKRPAFNSLDNRYFGSQVVGDSSNPGGLLFSVWDKLERRVPPGRVAACLARGAPNATWCEHQHAFALSPNCHRHCLDCGLHKGWHNTTGVQCHVPMRLAAGERLRLRLRRVNANTTFDEPTQGLGLMYHGSVWELTAMRVGMRRATDRGGYVDNSGSEDGGGDNDDARGAFVVGRMFWERTYGGISRFGAFHEHIGCCECDAFFESEVRTGPWVHAPISRAVHTIGFSRMNVSCQRYQVAIRQADPAAGQPYAAAQISTGPGTGPM